MKAHLSSFQFHTGSIKSVRVMRIHLFFIRFNSILVRLKESTPEAHERFTVKFQFHTGSIKSYLEHDLFVITNQFQFHTGSIKRRSRLHTPKTMMKSFNSILVRLKGGKRHPLPYRFKFQFHTGSIKRIKGKRPVKFNFLFQFHTGSIKSHSNPDMSIL